MRPSPAPNRQTEQAPGKAEFSGRHSNAGRTKTRPFPTQAWPMSKAAAVQTLWTLGPASHRRRHAAPSTRGVRTPVVLQSGGPAIPESHAECEAAHTSRTICFRTTHSGQPPGTSRGPAMPGARSAGACQPLACGSSPHARGND